VLGSARRIVPLQLTVVAGGHAHGEAKFYAAEMTHEEIRNAFADEGLSPNSWSNDANYFYEEHSHDYDKVLYCVEGEVTFHLKDGDVLLHPGQRVDIPAGTPHAATVGPHGVECMEAAIRHG
jgi:mannose-6-phosphate isomerase-like protein (cupin superfamily)